MTDTPTHDSLQPRSGVDRMAEAAGMMSNVKMSPSQPGIPEALDHLRYANSEFEDAIERLENRISPALLASGPSDPDASAKMDRMPQSSIAEATHNEAARLERSISRLRDIIGRVDL